MLSVKEAMRRIERMTPEEWERILKKSLDDAHIEYCNTLGKVIFNGLPPELLGECGQVIAYNYTAETTDIVGYCRAVNYGKGVSVRFSSGLDARFRLQSFVPAA